MGLEAYPRFSLAEARKAAASGREMAKVDLRPRAPIIERRRQTAQADRNLNVLRDIAKGAFQSRKAQLKGDGKALRWFSPIE